MNSLYTSGVRQTSSIQTDLERMRNGDYSPALIGQVSASLAAMSRTIDDYDTMAKREIIKSKQEKAQMRVQKFKSDYSELRSQFERLRTESAAQNDVAQRSELLASSGTSAPSHDTRRRFQPTPHQGPSTLHPSLQPDGHSESPFRSSSYSGRDYRALDEHTFIRDTDTKLDDFIAQGREVLDSLVDQRNMLKGTQRRLLDAANTMGLSRNVIGWIEKRSTQDMYIFLVGAVATFVCFFLIWKYLG